LLAFVKVVFVVTSVPPLASVNHPTNVYPALVGLIPGSLYFELNATPLLAGLTPVPPFWS